MATTDTTVNNLIINKLTKAQYDAIQSPSDTELYLIPDEIDSVPTGGSDNPVKSGGVYSALANKANSADLAAVATSGSYKDLSNKPTIPDAVSGTNDGTNWTSITIGSTTKAIPSGEGGGGSSQVQSDWNQTDTTAVDFIKNKPTNLAHIGDSQGSATIANFDPETDTVHIAAQVLSAAAQAQVRTNIGAQEALVSGTNIKTINNESLLGSGNISISGGGGGGEANVIEAITFNGVAAPVTNKTAAITAVIPDKVVVVDGSTLPASLDPNKVYQLGTLTGSVTIPAFSSVQSGDTEVKIWCFTFNTSTTAPTITWPAGITGWSGGSAPTINASKSYEVTVMDGIGVIIEA